MDTWQIARFAPSELILLVRTSSMGDGSKRKRHRLELKEFSPNYIRTHGLLLRKYLYGMDGITWFNATRELFAYMASFPEVKFMTVGQYATDCLENVVDEL
jgi:hypothetical protein